MPGRCRKSWSWIRSDDGQAAQRSERAEDAPAGGAPRIIQAIAEARAHGDLSENAEYHAAKEAQSHNEGRIAELEDRCRGPT